MNLTMTPKNVHEPTENETSALRHLADLSRIALEHSQLDWMASRIADYLRQHFKVDLAEISLRMPAALNSSERQRGSLRLIAQRGTSALGLGVGDQFPPDAGLTARALKTASSVYAPDVLQEPDFIRSHPNCRSNYVVPIMFQGQALGVINLESTERDFFDSQDRLVIDTLAQQIGGAVHLARLNEQLSVAMDVLGRTNRKLKASNSKLSSLSLRDQLTGIGNRRAIEQQGSRALNKAIREGHCFAGAILDVDHFKRFNDSYGHVAGDALLRELGHVLRTHARRHQALVGRFGGEEFVVIWPEQGPERVRALAERLRERLRVRLSACASKHAPGTQAERRGLNPEHAASRVPVLQLFPSPSASTPATVTVSMGVHAALPAEGSSLAQWISAADAALYQAKRAGRNRVAFSC